SELSFFEDEVLPFLAREAALFHPGYSAEDRVRCFSVCGGVPYYLERFPDVRPLTEHLLDEVFERTGLLHNEAELMLRQLISDPANHSAVLRSIAHGQNRNSEISNRTGLETAHVTKILNTLARPQLRTSELAAAYVRNSVLPHLDHHASQTWEDVCREHVLRVVPEVRAVGRWWGQVPTDVGRRTEEREIDVVGTDSDVRVAVIGMCKWTSTPVDFDELNLQQRLAVRQSWPSVCLRVARFQALKRTVANTARPPPCSIARRVVLRRVWRHSQPRSRKSHGLPGDRSTSLR
ncbi:MAG: hypothetical protein GEU86_13575, partial [Actinophytocola sp.]|nr:hypothetical protein [Actinophytocola sp.]